MPQLLGSPTPRQPGRWLSYDGTTPSFCRSIKKEARKCRPSTLPMRESRYSAAYNPDFLSSLKSRHRQWVRVSTDEHSFAFGKSRHNADGAKCFTPDESRHIAPISEQGGGSSYLNGALFGVPARSAGVLPGTRWQWFWQGVSCLMGEGMRYIEKRHAVELI